jgi:metallo-beta-lactamase family protein
MELEFYGGAGRVTGSCHILRIGGRQVLLDCGMVQGGKDAERANRESFPFDPKKIDAVILSHAHLDHSGRLPLLVKRGFKGTIYTQNATRDLCDILLADAASLAERDAEWYNRKRRRKNEPSVEPLFTRADADAAVDLMIGIKYRQTREVLPGVKLTYRDAGHILGSCVVSLELREGDQVFQLVFSGDLGQYDTPILHDPAVIERADLVIMESTYGNRLHRERGETIKEIGEIISAARHDRGNVLIPAFAIGRSQELLYHLGTHFDEWDMDRWEVFLDSPMAIRASQVYWDYPHLYDEEATKLRRAVNEMPKLRNLRLTETPQASMGINRIRSGALIIAGSGMLNGGRIVHHLKHNIWRKECQIIIAGYQARGTLGRRLVDGETSIRIHGDDYRVCAHIHTVGGLSAHADRDDLLKWLSGFERRPAVYLVHGEPDSAEALRDTIDQRLAYQATVATPGLKVPLVAKPDGAGSEGLHG